MKIRFRRSLVRLVTGEHDQKQWQLWLYCSCARGRRMDGICRLQLDTWPVKSPCLTAISVLQRPTTPLPTGLIRIMTTMALPPLHVGVHVLMGIDQVDARASLHQCNRWRSKNVPVASISLHTGGYGGLIYGHHERPRQWYAVKSSRALMLTVRPTV